ncbi:MAG: hypothetical protein IJ685_07295 [Selenomonadaceae bacterium]|nr:hypothetical protein [Selenomonadaceae bacterium]
MNPAKIFLCAAIIFFALNFSVANAEIVTVEATESYIFDNEVTETPAAATEHAREKARRAAVEQVQVIVMTHSQSNNSRITEDIIKTYAGGILNGAQYKIWNGVTSDGHFEIFCKITAQVDTSLINAEKILNNETLLKEGAEKDKRIRELEAELERLKSENKTADKVQREKIQTEFDRTQNQFLVAKYERDLDIYDFGKKINLQDMMTTAEKLAALDAGNASAFRGIVFVYRHEEKIQDTIDYCKKVLAANTSVELSIEACAQLGDIYYNEIFDTPTAKKYVDQGIALVKKKYSKAEIEKLVNGTNVEVRDLQLIGRSNTIRELYILKADIENVNPKFDAVFVVENLDLVEDRIYNIKYRTNW